MAALHENLPNAAGDDPDRSKTNQRESYAFIRWIPGWIRDLVWPAVLPLTNAEARSEQEKRNRLRQSDRQAIAALENETDDAALTAAEKTVQASLDTEDARRAGVESRLTTVLGMVSVAASLAFGALTSVFSKGFQGVNAPSAIVGAALMVYAAVQLVNALLAAIRGLQRAGYLTINPADVLPHPGETRTQQRIRAMNTIVETRIQHADVNSRKVDAMAVAHRALRNFVVAVLLLSFLIAGVMVWPREDQSIEHRVMTTLRSDSSMIDLLRGPRGPRGEPGPRGAQGEQGPRGPVGPSGAPSR